MHATRKMACQIPGGLDRQPGVAAPARARQRQQPHARIPHERFDAFELLFTSDERGPEDRERVVSS